LMGLVSIVTGGGAGIGQATAELFAEEGSIVVIVDVDEIGGKSTAEKIIDNKGLAEFIKVDISKESECESLAKRVFDTYKKIDILINNAGVFVLKGFSSSYEDWTRSFSVNVFGTFFVTKYVVEKMKENKLGGSVVNLGSISAHVAQPDFSCYAATKATIVGMTRNMALDLAPFNIRVNSVSPGSVFTAGSEKHAKSINVPIEDFKAQQGALNVQKRMALPREIAAPILFLASQDASFITGTDLLVDGGYTLV